MSNVFIIKHIYLLDKNSCNYHYHAIIGTLITTNEDYTFIKDIGNDGKQKLLRMSKERQFSFYTIDQYIKI